MRMVRHFFIFFAIALLFAWIQTAQAENVLKRGLGSQWETLDPQKTFDVSAGWIIDEAYEGLVSHDGTGAPVPGSAEKWDVSDDGKVWTFHLRDNLKWSDGSPVTAQDFVNGILRRLNKELASPQAYYFYSILSVINAKEYNEGMITDPKMVGLSAPDDKTLIMTMKNPYPAMLSFLSSLSTSPVHTPSLEKSKGDFSDPSKQVYNGAYMITEVVPQSHVTLVKNPHYWDAANVKIDKVVYLVTEDANTELKRYKSGDLDISFEIPIDQTDALIKKTPDEVHISSSVESIYYSFNITKPPFDNLKFRKALSFAIDRETLAKKIVKDGRLPQWQFVVEGDPNYKGPKLEEASLDKDMREKMARELLKESGVDPKTTHLEILTSTNEANKKQAEGVAIMWKKILGLNVKIVAQDRKTWLDNFNAGNWTIFSDNIFVDYVGPEPYMDYMRPSSESGYNWKNQEYEDLMDKAKATANLEERNKILAQVEKILLDEYLTAPLASGVNRHLIKPRVKGWHDNPGDWHAAKYMELVE